MISEEFEAAVAWTRKVLASWGRGAASSPQCLDPTDPHVEAALLHWLLDSTKDEQVYDALARLAAHYLAEDKPMPRELRSFAAPVLIGAWPRPSKRGRKSNRAEDVRLHMLVKLVAQRFDISTYSKGETNTPTAVQIVGEAMRQEGLATTERQLIRAFDSVAY